MEHEVVISMDSGSRKPVRRAESNQLELILSKN